MSRSSDAGSGAEADARAAAAAVESRLESLREFAYGAGHEINNPLANIATRAQALLLDEPDPERRRRLAAIVDQAFRARDMIGGLMVFARPPKAAPGIVAVGSIVAAVIEAVRPVAAARGVRLEYAPPPQPLEVFVDVGQVTEALRILVLNGLEATEAGGRVAIEARSAADGLACELVVSDDGRGMDAATLRRAFDPFFSGREAGRGIGLGLPKAWRLLANSGGSIDVESRPGRGSRLTIRLPRPAGRTGAEATAEPR